MGKHTKYHCGNIENPYSCNPENNNNRVIDIGIYHGSGIPKGEMVKFDNKPMFNREAHKWKCLVFDYQGGKYQLFQVFGHIAATHGDKSGIVNARWDIPIED